MDLPMGSLKVKSTVRAIPREKPMNLRWEKLTEKYSDLLKG